MSRYNTNNSVPSNQVRDFSDNAQIVDETVHLQQKTTKDRFGNDVKTFYGMNQEFDGLMTDFSAQIQQAIINAGYQLIDSFQAGAEITLRNQALHWTAPDGDDEYYRWDGALPKTVPTGSTPASSGEIKKGAWVGIGDAALRSDLSGTVDGKGDALIAVKQPITGWPGRTQHDRNFDYLNLKDAAGNTIVGNDWTAALQMYIEYLETLQQGLTPPYAPPAMDLPPGDYGISAPLWFKQAVHIRGKGVRIYALPGFTPVTVELQAGGTELYHGMFLFLNGKKGAVSGEGQLRFNVTIDEGLVIDCKDIAYPNIYMERFANPSINCVLQNSVHDGIVFGPSSWGLSADNLIVENFSDAAIRFMERSAVNGAKLNVKIWGDFKEGLSGIQFDSESACNGVIISGFIEKVKYGIIASRSTGTVELSGVDFEQCQFNVIRAASDMSDGRKVGPITFRNCFLHSISSSKIYAEGAIVKAVDCRMYTGGTGDFETDTARNGLIIFDNCQFDAGAVGIIAGSNVRGEYTHTLGTSIYNYLPKELETFSDAWELRNYEWSGYPLTQTSGYSFSSRTSIADNRDYGRSLWWISDRTSTDVQTVTGVTLASDNAIRYFGPMADNLISCGAASTRFSVVYSAAGTITTSDAMEKQQQRLLYEAEKKAASEIKSSIRAFKRNDEVEKSGNDAKWHFGVMAQEVAEIFKRNGLKYEDYDFLSFETWDDVPGVVDDETKLILSPAVPSGSRWGVKYSQLICFIISTL